MSGKMKLEKFVSEKANLPLETAILLIAGMTMLITGGLLFPVFAGILPYHENGFLGLLLLMFALQMITLGKTPFGETGRSKPVFILGTLIAVTGIITCIIPAISGRIPHILLFICLGPGSLFLLLQMFFARDKFQTWIKYGGVLLYLIPACALVYVFSILIALLTWKQSLPATPVSAILILIYGMAIIFLAFVLHKIYGIYPEAEKTGRDDIGFSIDQIIMMLMGIFMLLLGILLIPVNLGLLPFSESAQLGLLMVIFAVQMLASGNTPIGPFPRSWLVILFGLLFAAMGIVSCVIPKILVSQLTVLVGLLNILGAVISIWKMCVPNFGKPKEPVNQFSPILTKIFVVQMFLNILSILFGISMFVSNLIPGLVIGVILAANGVVLLYLLQILTVVDKIKSELSRIPAP